MYVLLQKLKIYPVLLKCHKAMKTINMYFKFQFTSLSPDAQPISVWIVSDELPNISDAFERAQFKYLFNQEPTGKHSKSFYAEFSDFQVERCDDWVKENVVSKLKYNKSEMAFDRDELKNGNVIVKDNTEGIKQHLKGWLKHFSDYQIQFIVDCGTWDWYWMVQLLAEWDEVDLEEYCHKAVVNVLGIDVKFTPSNNPIFKIKTGLPKLPANISPVPFDLNDLIAIKKGITPKEAFDLNREELIESRNILEEIGNTGKVYNLNQFPKHNALWDAKVIKGIYNKLSHE